MIFLGIVHNHGPLANAKIWFYVYADIHFSLFIHGQMILCFTNVLSIFMLHVFNDLTSFMIFTIDHLCSLPGGSGDHRGGEMHLLPDPLFSIPTDGVYITSIVGADNGRVFMAGKDGCLYELVYQVCE